MSREDIRTANPGGVSNLPAPRTGDELATEGDCTPPIPDLQMPLPERNVPARLSFACGLLAVVFAVGGYLTACDSPQWLARVLAYCPLGTGAALLMAMAAFVLGVLGTVERVWYPTSGGLLWALGGLAMSALTVCAVLATLGESASHWS